MKDFVKLFNTIDQTTKTNAKVEALALYFKNASDADRIWTIAILSHRRPRRTVTTTLLRTWAAEYGNLPLWLFEESYHVVGDLAETIALVLPKPLKQSNHPLSYWIEYIKALKDVEEEEKKVAILQAWNSLGHEARFIFNKLITGGWRIGISQKLMVRALSKFTGIEENLLAHRLMGNWDPSSTSFDELVLSENPLDDISKPYPFYLAYALEDEPVDLGQPEEWQAERKWDGIRGQIIIRKKEIFVWSRGEELITDKFPEFNSLVDALPEGTVLDGEILPFKDGKVLSFNVLQTRIGRKNISKKTLETAPVVLVAYDLLEFEGQDIRHESMAERRKKLESLLDSYRHESLLLSPVVKFSDWDVLKKEQKDSRAHNCEGLMLKRKDSPYKIGRKKGDWWKWKVEPLTIDAVMIYAMRGHGRRANLYTDYTFAVWNGDELVSFAKAYSGLKDTEFQEITRFVKQNTVERFGPVRSVKPELVFELAFEGINRSKRHKSGVALRFPRMKRWRKDKSASEANTLDDLLNLLNLYGQ
ncbi:MAG: ATP-dependent DNA ligase [Bacteroidota bacterium]